VFVCVMCICVPIYDKYTYSRPPTNSITRLVGKTKHQRRPVEEKTALWFDGFGFPGKFWSRAHIRRSSTLGSWLLEIIIFVFPLSKNSRLPGRPDDNALITRRYLLLRLDTPLRHRNLILTNPSHCCCT